jgi:hypothetical protein
MRVPQAWERFAAQCLHGLKYADTKPKKTPTWFAFSEDRPLGVFAGVMARASGSG